MPVTQASLSAAADDRKARLAKLKNLKRKQPADEIAPPESERSASPPTSASKDLQAPPPPTHTQAGENAEAEAKAEAEAEAKAKADRDAESQAAAVARLHLSGRNYDAETRGPKLGFEAPPTLGMEGPTLEQQAAEVEGAVRLKAAEDARDDKGIDLFKLQPKKPNWDLKRDLDRKLEVLSVRTDNAIARLVRERIAGAQAAARKTAKATAVGNGAANEGAEAGLDGVALVEGLRVREREEEEEERREREDEDKDVV
ncbi:cwf18 pre-mRNA splicing factor-domain-containing protein [Hypoxylon sp. NC1633]|nr:cwf18 pre-mRNA splicing factor-domain-containing protein [Hypoxylon sp. NC1633]